MGAGSRTVEGNKDLADQLIEASHARQYLDFATSGIGGAIDAEVIRHVLVGRCPELDPFGLRMANVLITGHLDLRAVMVPIPLRFIGCSFEQAVTIEGANLHDLVISDGRNLNTPVASRLTSSLPGLQANGVHIQRDLNLSGTVITGQLESPASASRTSAVWLTEADLGGRLLCFGTKIETRADRALQVDRTSIAGDVRLIQGFESNAEIRLLAIQLGGSLDLSAASLCPRNGRALDLADAIIGGSLFILSSGQTGVRPAIHGRLELGGTTINGRVLIRNADLTAPKTGEGIHVYGTTEAHARPLLIAPRLTVHGEFVVEGSSVLSGGTILDGADLKGGLNLTEGVQVANPGAAAISLANASLGSELKARRCVLRGSVGLSSAHIAGRLDLREAVLSDAQDHRYLDADDATIDGDVHLAGLKADGGSFNFRACAITGGVIAARAAIRNPGGRTLSLHNARVRGNVLLDKAFESVGTLALNRAVIEGRLNCAGARLLWQAGPDDDPGTVLEAISATFRSGLGLGLKEIDGVINLVDANASYLADDLATDWRGGARLTGFAYRRFAPLSGDDETAWDLNGRISWLTTIAGNDPSPWEEAARAFRARGNHASAEEILIAYRRLARKTQTGRFTRPRRAWDAFLDRSIRYGYRPGRAVLALGILIFLVFVTLFPSSSNASMRATDESSVVYTPQGALDTTPTPSGSAASMPSSLAPGMPATTCASGKVRCFSPFFYAIDTVVPIIDLGQRSTWYPTRDSAWGRILELWLYTATILGWIASTIFALSFTRLGRGSTP